MESAKNIMYNISTKFIFPLTDVSTNQPISGLNTTFNIRDIIHVDLDLEEYEDTIKTT